jgi:hypothetical protein
MEETTEEKEVQIQGGIQMEGEMEQEEEETLQEDQMFWRQGLTRQPRKI